MSNLISGSSAPLVKSRLRAWYVHGTPFFNKTAKYGDCFVLGSVSQDQGSVTNIKCPNPRLYSQFAVVSQQVEPASLVEMSLEERVSENLGIIPKLARSDAPFTVWGVPGTGNIAFNNIQANKFKTLIFQDGKVTDYETTELVSLDEESAVDYNGSANFLDWYEYPNLDASVIFNATADQIVRSVYVHERVVKNETEYVLIVGTANVAASGELSSVHISTDFGSSWTQHDIPFAPFNNTATSDSPIISVIEENLMVAVNSSSIVAYASIQSLVDGTPVWDSTNLPNAITRVYTPFSESHSLYIRPSAIYKLDGNFDVTTYDIPLSDSPVMSVFNVDCVHGIIGGNSGGLAVTSNGGESWTSITPPAALVGQSIRGGMIVDANTFAIAGFSVTPTIWYYTTDGGVTWKQSSGHQTSTNNFQSFTVNGLVSTITGNGEAHVTIGNGVPGSWIKVPFSAPQDVEAIHGLPTRPFMIMYGARDRAILTGVSEV